MFGFVKSDCSSKPSAGAVQTVISFWFPFHWRRGKQALAQSNGVVAHAAKLLNTRRTTLVEKLRKYGLSREVAGDPEAASESETGGTV